MENEKIEGDHFKKLLLVLLACLLLAFDVMVVGNSWSVPLLYTLILLVSAYLFLKYRKNLERKDYLVALIFSALVGLAAYFTNSFYYYVAVICFFSYLGGTATSKEYGGEVVLFSGKPLKTFIVTLVLSIVLSAVNVWMAAQSVGGANLKFSKDALFFALTPGISEELLMRFIPYVLCIVALKSNPQSKRESFVTYLTMILPHVLIHFSFGSDHVLNIILSSIILSALFGFPMAYLQRKFSLTSAIVLHFIVDLVRFLFLQG